ncbi:hypothetical protein L1D32_11165 [Shewanella insulae]|uniref:hypothetical protein n=1 Tax=Shewanella insulae TaxID=2681496 RepID=UPI001EFD2E6A|nr:hypothetical protein [Shewanella insulae]MCG9738718.1 hypothetical protein [Shewanella insulae]
MDDDKRRTYAGSLSLLSPLVLLVLLALIVGHSPLVWLVVFTVTFVTMVGASVWLFCANAGVFEALRSTLCAFMLGNSYLCTPFWILVLVADLSQYKVVAGIFIFQLVNIWGVRTRTYPKKVDTFYS